MPVSEPMDILRMYLAAPTATEWWRFAAVLGGLAAFVGAGEAVRHVFRWSPEFTRKLVHVSVGLLVFFAPVIFVVPLPAILLAVIFIAGNYLAVRLDLLQGMHGTGRRTYGTVYYPLAFLILVLLFWYTEPIILSCSILVLAFGDAAAAIVGESVRAPRIFHLSSDKKSVQGSMTMGLVSFVTLVAALLMLTKEADRNYALILAASGVAALTATAWEALSSRGLDNLTVPLSVAFILTWYLLPAEQGAPAQLTIGAGLAILIAALSSRGKLLAPSGAVATFILATVVFGLGGWQWTTPILTFFLSSSLLSKVAKSRKPALEEVQEKSSVRDYAQVFANGGIAGILIILSYFYPSHDWYPLYLGSLAAVTADTWSTEIGILGRGPTIMITTLKSVAAGRNGGISWQGIAGALGGSLLLLMSGLWWIGSADVAVIVAAAGVAGSLADSFLGATIQAEYRCPACNALTERRVHCTNQPTLLVRGAGWITNDIVNWTCAAVGSLFVGLVG